MIFNIFVIINLFRHRGSLFSIYKRDILESVNERFYKISQNESSKNILELNEAKRNQIYETDKYGGVADVRLNKLFALNQDGINYYLAKYDYSPDNNVNRIPLLKIAEMYLIIAECADSWEHLKTLRRMRGLKAMAPGNTLQQEIEAEYLKELVGEGQLFYYYKRLNQLVNGNMTDDGKFVLPIPDAEKERGLIN